MRFTLANLFLATLCLIPIMWIATVTNWLMLCASAPFDDMLSEPACHAYVERTIAWLAAYLLP